MPKYGYLLESGDGRRRRDAVDLLDDARRRPVCDPLQSVELVRRAGLPRLRDAAGVASARHKDVTYINVSAAPHTWPIIEAQGFSRYCDGVFVAVPMLKGLFGSGGVRVFDARAGPTVSFDPFEQEILLRHAEHGCISLWCETPDAPIRSCSGRALVKGAMPCAQLIYCRDVDDFVRFAGPIGRYLARRGKPFVIVDSNGAIPGLSACSAAAA